MYIMKTKKEDQSIINKVRSLIMKEQPGSTSRNLSDGNCVEYALRDWVKIKGGQIDTKK